MIRLRRVVIEPTEWGCVSRFDDGSSFGAHEHQTPHYHVISHRCGYGDDLRAYCIEHEFSHHFLAERLGGGVSPIIWALAHRETPEPGAAAIEELAVQAFQRWLRANERPIVGGTDWDALKRDALALLG